MEEEDRSITLLRLAREHAHRDDEFLQRLARAERAGNAVAESAPTRLAPRLPDNDNALSIETKVRAAVAAKKAARKMKGLAQARRGEPSAGSSTASTEESPPMTHIPPPPKAKKKTKRQKQ